MAKNKMQLTSNFRAAKNAGHEAIQLAVAHAVDEGQEKASDRLDKAAASRGYDLQGSDVDKQVGFKDGKIMYQHWYGHFFEYGTVFIKAMPFIRPGHRQMRKVFVADMGVNFEKWIRRRAGVRR